jgi:Ca-activated chloride channel family protein
LVKEVTQTFYAVADDVLLNVHFNSSAIKQYRLIGFDNKKDAIADTTGELEGGEVGSGNSVMAIFEVLPQMDNFQNGSGSSPIAQVTLNYSVNNEKVRKQLNYDCTDNYLEFKDIDKEYRLGTAIAMFGMKLRQSKYIRNAQWNDIEIIATNAYNPKDYLQKEFVQLVSIAKKMYSKKRRNKKND